MDKIKKILILSASNPYKTAGIVAYDILKGFTKEGYFAKLLVENFDNYEDDDIICIQSRYSFLLKRFLRKIKNTISKKVIRSNNKVFTIAKYHFDPIGLINQSYSTKKILQRAGFKPDVIIVIFAQYFISYKNLYELQNMTGAKIFWQFADENPFTGGCHYSWDCKGYENSCVNCPAVVSNKNKRLPENTLKEKLYYSKLTQIVPVIGSDWLINKAKNSSLFSKSDIKKIYLPIDAKEFIPFTPKIKNKLREKYSIDKSKTVLLIMANYLDHERKGIKLIMNSLNYISEEIINRKSLHLLIVGNNFNLMKKHLSNRFQYTYINHVDRRRLPEIYNISNIFISASLQDVGPYTLTEALLCGVPVVALNHGYANEFVINKKTGILVNSDKPKDLYEGIMVLLNMKSEQLDKINKESRIRTLPILSRKRQIQDYKKILNE